MRTTNATSVLWSTCIDFRSRSRQPLAHALQRALLCYQHALEHQHCNIMQWYMILCYQRALEHHQCALHVVQSRIGSSAFLFHFPARLGQSVHTNYYREHTDHNYYREHTGEHY